MSLEISNKNILNNIESYYKINKIDIYRIVAIVCNFSF